MFDHRAITSLLPAASGSPGVDAATVTGWVAALSGPLRELTDAGRVDLISVLEQLKAAAAAAQARAAVDLDRSQRAEQAAAGVPAADLGRGVGAQVALARRESPARGARALGLAKVLTTEMPRTLAALSAGRLSEWRATLLARETACLSAEHRGQIDAELAGQRLGEIQAWGDARLVAEARRLAYRLDPHAALARVRHAENDRRVSSRPAPDTMAYLTALLPVAHAVACHAALTRAADTARASGDPRSRGQVMADTMVELLTGQMIAAGTQVEIQLVITDTALFANAPGAPAGPHPSDPDEDPGSSPDPREEPAELRGYGPVPAGWARDLIAGLPAEVRTWIRRLYTDPRTGALVAMDSRRRLFGDALREFLVIRDRTCRTPWCDAPVRHADHAIAHEDHGATSAQNGQGLCEACNHTKQAPGWAARPRPTPGRAHTVDLRTPTGHIYRSTAPPLPDPRSQATAAARRLQQLFEPAA